MLLLGAVIAACIVVIVFILMKTQREGKVESFTELVEHPPASAFKVK